jgi:SHAQKYF class myb-like DNA-binding protein
MAEQQQDSIIEGPIEEHENIGRWTVEEHQTFLEGYQIHGKNWKKVAGHVKTRSVVQVRTHAQKYFLKVHKFGDSPSKVESPKTPKSVLKKALSKKTISPPPETLPLLQSFNLLRYSYPIDFPRSFGMSSSSAFTIPPPLPQLDQLDTHSDPGNATPFKQPLFKDIDWFFTSPDLSEVVTDISDSGSDRKSSFDSAEAEGDIHLEHTIPPIDLHNFFNELMSFDFPTDDPHTHW